MFPGVLPRHVLPVADDVAALLQRVLLGFRGSLVMRVWNGSALQLLGSALDEATVSSCTYVEQPGGQLARAQHAKLDPVFRKRQLSPGQRIRDIGCG